MLFIIISTKASHSFHCCRKYVGNFVEFSSFRCFHLENVLQLIHLGLLHSPFERFLFFVFLYFTFIIDLNVFRVHLTVYMNACPFTFTEYCSFSKSPNFIIVFLLFFTLRCWFQHWVMRKFSFSTLTTDDYAMFTFELNEYKGISSIYVYVKRFKIPMLFCLSIILATKNIHYTF